MPRPATQTTTGGAHVPTAAAPELVALRLDAIVESPLNPRRHFDEAKLDELADSLRTVGQLTPVVVRERSRESGTSSYELAAGHRRFRAAQRAGLTELLAIVRPMSDAEFLEVLTVENVQRDDVHFLEEADGYAALLAQDRRHDVAWLAGRIGKSTRYVHDRLALRALVPLARELGFAGRIPLAHAVELGRLAPADQLRAMHPHRGGLWRFERADGAVDYSLDFRDRAEREAAEREEEELDEFADMDAGAPETETPEAELARTIRPAHVVQSVRELRAWIREHVRLRQDDPALAIAFPESEAQLAAVRDGLARGTLLGDHARVFEITAARVIPSDVRSTGARTLTAASWRPAERGECPHVVQGFHVHGARRGQTEPICRTKSCAVHWPELQAKQKGADAGDPASGRLSNEDWWRRERERQERERQQRQAMVAACTPVIPAVAAQLAAAVKKASLPTLVKLLPSNWTTPARGKYGKLVPSAATAEGLIRALAWRQVCNDLESDWSWQRDLVRVGKALKVDVEGQFKAALKQAASSTAATNGKGKPKAKAKRGRAS